MGLLFNTPATNALLQTLNTRYGTSSTSGIGYYGPIDLPLYQNTNNTLKAIWLTFGISINSSGSPNGDANWGDWLDNTLKFDNGLKTVHEAIREAMIHHLQDTNCIAIEFFAIPSNQILAHFPPAVPAPNGKHSGIITVETVTYDRTASFVHSLRTRNRS